MKVSLKKYNIFSYNFCHFGNSTGPFAPKLEYLDPSIINIFSNWNPVTQCDYFYAKTNIRDMKAISKLLNKNNTSSIR